MTICNGGNFFTSSVTWTKEHQVFLTLFLTSKVQTHAGHKGLASKPPWISTWVERELFLCRLWVYVAIFAGIIYPKTEHRKKTGDGGWRGTQERVCRERGGPCGRPLKDQPSLSRSERKTKSPSLYAKLQHEGCVGIVGLRKPSTNSLDLQWLLVVPFLVRPCALLCLNCWMSELQMGSRGDSEGKYLGPLRMIKNDITECSSYRIKNSKYLLGDPIYSHSTDRYSG